MVKKKRKGRKGDRREKRGKDSIEMRMLVSYSV